MHRNSSFWHSVWRIVKNKYVATILFFSLYILFLSQNSFLVINRLRHQVSNLHDEEQQLGEALRQDSVRFGLFQSDAEALERYGRETYFLKRSDEDVFIFQEK